MYYECMYLSPKDTSLIRTELFGRRGVLIRGGPLYCKNVDDIDIRSYVEYSELDIVSFARNLLL